MGGPLRGGRVAVAGQGRDVAPGVRQRGPRWATRAWMTQAAALPDCTLVAVGIELKGGEHSSAARMSVPAGE